MNHYIAIGPVPWIDSEDGGYFSPPPGVSGWIDLAPVGEQAVPGMARGCGIFLTDAPLPSTWATIGRGDLREFKPDGLARQAWRSQCGYRPQGDTLSDWLIDHLTSGADPSGNAACRPLMPTGQSLQVWIANTQIHRTPFGQGSRHWNKVVDMWRRELATAREESLAGRLRCPFTGKADTTMHRKIADAICDRFGIELEEILPKGWGRDETRVPHATTITESFNTADSTTLGPDLSWTEHVGDMEVFSNQCRQVTAATQSTSRADSDLSSSDNYAQASLVARGTTATGTDSVICRKDNTATQSYYHGGLLNSGGSDSQTLRKVISGATTTIGTDTGVSVSLPQLMKVSAVGSTISGYWNGSLIQTATDSAWSTGTRGGIRYGGGGSVKRIVDAFEAGDVVSGIVYVQLESSPRGIARGTWQRTGH